MDKLHDTGVVKLENGTFAKHENEKLTDSEKKRAMLNG